MTNLSAIDQAGQPSTFDNQSKIAGRKSTVFTTHLYRALVDEELKIEQSADVHGLTVVTKEGRYNIANQTSLLTALKSVYIKDGVPLDKWLLSMSNGFLSAQQKDATQKARGVGVSKRPSKVQPAREVLKSIIIETLNSNDSLLDDVLKCVVSGSNGYANILDSLSDRLDSSSFIELYNEEVAELDRIEKQLKADEAIVHYFEELGFTEIVRVGCLFSMTVSADTAPNVIPQVMDAGHTVTKSVTDWNSGVVSVYIAPKEVEKTPGTEEQVIIEAIAKKPRGKNKATTTK